MVPGAGMVFIEVRHIVVDATGTQVLVKAGPHDVNVTGTFIPDAPCAALAEALRDAAPIAVLRRRRLGRPAEERTMMARHSRALYGTFLLLLPLLAVGLLDRPTPLRLASPRLCTIPLAALPDALALDPSGAWAYIGTDGTGAVYGIDLRGGRPDHAHPLFLPGRFAPLALALDAHTQHLFVADWGVNGGPSHLHVLQTPTLRQEATVAVGLAATALTVDTRHGRVVVANTNDGTVSLLDARTGALLRTTPVGGAPLALAVDPQTAHAVVVSGAATPPYNLGLGPDGGHVTTLDTRSGRVIHTATLGIGPWAVAVDQWRGRAFVASAGAGTVSVLDTRMGRLRRVVAVGDKPVALAVDARRDAVFVVNAGDGTVSILDARSGGVRHTRAILHDQVGALSLTAIAVDAARDRVYVTATGRLDHAGLRLRAGRLFVLKASDGTLVRTLQLGAAPQGVAVAARGQVVVVDSGGAIRLQHDGVARWGRQVVRWLPLLAPVLPRMPAAAGVPAGLQVLDVSR